MTKRILLIDDEEKVRRLYTRVLEGEGYLVHSVQDAEEATELLLREWVDLILLDINMPEIDGKFMSQVIEDFGRKVKIIVFSVYPLGHQRKMIPQADDYFDKGQGPEHLVQKIGTMLSDLSVREQHSTTG